MGAAQGLGALQALIGAQGVGAAGSAQANALNQQLGKPQLPQQLEALAALRQREQLAMLNQAAGVKGLAGTQLSGLGPAVANGGLHGGAGVSAMLDAAVRQEKLNMLSANMANMVPSPAVGPAAASGLQGLQGLQGAAAGLQGLQGPAAGLQGAAAGLLWLQGAAANPPGANLNGDILKSLMGQLGHNGQNQPQ